MRRTHDFLTSAERIAELQLSACWLVERLATLGQKDPWDACEIAKQAWHILDDMETRVVELRTELEREREIAES